jgi:hypothetical protein
MLDERPTSSVMDIVDIPLPVMEKYPQQDICDITP